MAHLYPAGQAKLIEGVIAGLMSRHREDLLAGMDVSIEDDENGIHQTIVHFGSGRFIIKVVPEKTIIEEVI